MGCSDGSQGVAEDTRDQYCSMNNGSYKTVSTERLYDSTSSQQQHNTTQYCVFEQNFTSRGSALSLMSTSDVISGWHLMAGRYQSERGAIELLADDIVSDICN